MKARVIGIIAAVLVHAVILLFGGIFFYTEKEKAALAPSKEIELFSEEETAEAKKPDEKPDEKKDEEEEKRPQEQIEVQDEKPPDMRELFRGEEMNTPQGTDAVARLDAVSLSALASALEGGGGGGDFSFGVNLTSGGRIGGTGAPGQMQAEGGGDAVFDVAELDQRARPIFQTPPVYPMSLRKQKVEATVYLVFIVDDQGRVLNPKVEKTTHGGFDDAALAAVRNWKFEPAVRGGEKVASKLRIPIRFSLSG